MENRRKKIGIMGGTFDPIHVGHLILGEKAYEQLGLDKILFMPAGNPPHKRNRKGRASDEQRVEMVNLAIQGNPHFELSLIEMNAEGFTYTYRTLETLKKQNPDTDYYFIIGADSLYNFATWMEPARICQACTIVVATQRPRACKKSGSGDDVSLKAVWRMFYPTGDAQYRHFQSASASVASGRQEYPLLCAGCSCKLY